MSKRVVIIGGGLSAKHTAETLLKKRKDLEVTVVQANKFVEWPLAMAVCMVKPDLHDKALGTDCKKFEVPNASYKYGVAKSVDTANKLVQVKLADGAEESISYDALIVATGFKMPAVYPGIGATLEERKAEIQRIGAAIKQASSVVIAGGGPVGLELAGNIRVEYPDKKVKLLCRGGVLPAWPSTDRSKFEAQLKKMNIEVLTGDESAPTDYKLEPGNLTFGGVDVSYDVFFPIFNQGPNTQFLASSADVLDPKGSVDTNEYLQGKACKEIFAVGVSNVKEAFIGMPKLEAQWNSAASNALALLEGKPLKPHKEGMPSMQRPALVFIGAGAKGWGRFDFSGVPAPLKCCCCCGYGGFPCCPPPCCWPCCGACPCGYCGMAPEGGGPATFAESIAFKSSSFHFKGVGEAPAQQAMQ